MSRRGGHALGVAVLALALAMAAPAQAEPPTLLSVSQSVGRIKATFVVPPDGQSDRVEVSRRPDVGPDGSFVEVLHEETLIEDDSWTSEIRFLPGVYYVHVSSNDFGCEGCPPREWSAVLPVEVLPILPLAGTYSGPVGDFGSRIKFRLARDGMSLRALTLTYELECSVATIRRRHAFDVVAIRNGEFTARARIRFRGGARESISVTGKLSPPRRASGRFKSILSIPRIGRCTPFTQGRRGLAWSALRR
jgi:hypothetical protein